MLRVKDPKVSIDFYERVPSTEYGKDSVAYEGNIDSWDGSHI
jgi:catechol 2,3-dioxygenase-like lactoylglutathione lyase family enzyme